MGYRTHRQRLASSSTAQHWRAVVHHHTRHRIRLHKHRQAEEHHHRHHTLLQVEVDSHRIHQAVERHTQDMPYRDEAPNQSRAADEGRSEREERRRGRGGMERKIDSHMYPGIHILSPQCATSLFLHTRSLARSLSALLSHSRSLARSLCAGIEWSVFECRGGRGGSVGGGVGVGDEGTNDHSTRTKSCEQVRTSAWSSRSSTLLVLRGTTSE